MSDSNNTFRNTVESLFKGMDSFITTKTVVGDAIHIGDTIILPLVDVSFGEEWVERLHRVRFLSFRMAPPSL